MRELNEQHGGGGRGGLSGAWPHREVYRIAQQERDAMIPEQDSLDNLFARLDSTKLDSDLEQCGRHA